MVMTATQTTHQHADPELKKYMRAIADANKTHNVVLRGLLTGIFTAVGTTIGFALLILLAAGLISNVKNVPILHNFLQQTKLDVLIEDQLSKIQSGNTSETDTVVEELYQDSTFGLIFTYPSTFTTVQQVSADSEGKIIQLIGNGALHSLEIYINKPAVLVGDSTQTQVKPEALQVTLDVSIYDQGAKVNGTEYKNAVFQTKFINGGDEYVFIGIAENNKPKLGREVYLGILQSLGFSK
jgi:hypothetical protein